MELVDLEAKDYMSVKLRLVMELVEDHVHTMGIPGECEHEASNILSADTNTTNGGWYRSVRVPTPRAS